MFAGAALKEHALALGFNLVGITPAVPSPRLDAYLIWVQAGMQGSMGYMARPDRQARRRNLRLMVPGVRSLIVVGLDFHTSHLPAEVVNDPGRGRIAAYAWGVDYHDVMAPRLEDLAGWLHEQAGQARHIAHRVYVDTGAILERSHGQQAGLGFVGKNTMLIHPRRGSYFFLGEILTDLEFDEYDTPHRETMCGTCTRCLKSCPTDAFPEPYVLDARRCISYLTIEHKGWIDPALRPRMGNWVFGCDICQDACPFSRFATPSRESVFFPENIDRAAPPLLDLLRLDAYSFLERFDGSPVARIGRERLVRNACIAAGNWGSQAALPALEPLLQESRPPLRGHAAWALARILGERSHNTLNALLRAEQEPQVRAELMALLGQAIRFD